MKLIYRLLNSGATKYFSHSERWGTDEKQSYSVFAPKNGGNSDIAVIFAYGGYWRTGSKEQSAFYAASLAAKGFTTVLVDYRLYPHVSHPQFVNDVASAINDFAEKNPKIKRIILAGHSAGGQIMALIAYNQQYRQLLTNSVSIAGYIAYAPALMFERNSELLKGIFPTGTKKTWQPYAAMDRYDVPACIFRAAFDEFVVAKTADVFAQKIVEHDGKAVVCKIRRVEHMLLFAAMSRLISWLFPVRRKTLRYLEEIEAT